jgi:hypothetical protein
MTDMTYGVNFAPLAVESAQPESEIEAELKSEIKSLWSAHLVGKTTAKRTTVELKALRLDLGLKLCLMKSILVRTGRGGGWAAYLRSCEVPRASAERYIHQHELVLNPKQIDLPETFSEPSDEDVRRLVRSLMPRLRRVLKTASWMEWFLVEVQYQWETADASTTGGQRDEAAPDAKGNSGDPSRTEVALLSDAA